MTEKDYNVFQSCNREEEKDEEKENKKINNN
jgi:hypothetical protein